MESPAHPPRHITDLPTELLDRIFFQLAANQPLGPPHAVLPFIRTCKTIYNKLKNPVSWARVFRLKFDCGSVQRREFTPTSKHYLDQLIRYSRALQVLRACDPYRGHEETNDSEMSLDDALMTGVVLMMENDGKNVRQLCEYAQAHRVLKDLVRYSLYREMQFNNGWPSENKRNAFALFLFWIITSEETIASETDQEREQISTALLPMVVVPYRYPSSHAPPQHFRLPFPSTLPSAPTSFPPTAHGPYPVWPPSDRSMTVGFYGTRLVLHVPLVAPTATLLFFARQEYTPLPIPFHLPRTRAELVAQEPGPTQEDVHELNWGWVVRLPQGKRVGPVSFNESEESHMGASWRWGVGDHINPFSDSWATHAVENGNHITSSVSRSQSGRSGTEIADPSVHSVASTSSSSSPSYSTSSPQSSPLWERTRKAPHTTYQLPTQGPHTFSRRWDADWWRMRLCGDPWVPRLPPGQVFEPGCLNGLWQGRFMTLGEEQLRTLISNPTFPGALKFRADMRFILQPFYICLREAHSVAPRASSTSSCSSSTSTAREAATAVDLGSRPTTVNVEGNTGAGGGAGTTTGWYENMTNAWFDGECGGTRFAIRRRMGSERVRECENAQDEEVAEIEVVDMEGGNRRKGVFPCWRARDPKGKKSERDDEMIFASAGLGMSSSSSSSSTGVREVYVVGSSLPRHRAAWGHHEFYGRVRPWDGLVGILRRPANRNSRGYLFFYGYIVGGETWVGHWRFSNAEGAVLGYEGAFAMSKREDESEWSG